MPVDYSPTPPTPGAARNVSPTEVERWTDYADTIADVDARLDDVEARGGYFDIIDHGGTAGTARTVGVATDGSEPVLWRGTVEPTNAVNGDDWLDYS